VSLHFLHNCTAIDVIYIGKRFIHLKCQITGASLAHKKFGTRFDAQHLLDHYVRVSSSCGIMFATLLTLTPDTSDGITL
jgi:hypothetical protein